MFCVQFVCAHTVSFIAELIAASVLLFFSCFGQAVTASRKKSEIIHKYQSLYRAAREHAHSNHKAFTTHLQRVQSIKKPSLSIHKTPQNIYRKITKYICLDICIYISVYVEESSHNSEFAPLAGTLYSRRHRMILKRYSTIKDIFKENP